MKKNKTIIQKWRYLPGWIKWVIRGAVSGFIVSSIILILFLFNKLHNLIATEYFPNKLYHLLDVTLDIYSIKDILSISKFIVGMIFLFSVLFWISFEIIKLIKKCFTTKMIKWFLIILGILLIIFIIYSVMWHTSTAKIQINPSDFCKRDNDCIKVDTGCCGCSQGGKAMAVSKSVYESPNCEGVMCIQVMSNHWSCFAKAKCINNHCALKESFWHHLRKNLI